MISGNSQYISMNRAYCLKEHATTLSKAAPLSSLSYIGKVKVKVTHSDPMDCILGWVVIPFSRGSSQPRGWTHVSCIGRWTLCHFTTREAEKRSLGHHNPIWLGSLQPENIWTQTCRERTPREDEGRDQGDASSQGTPKMASKLSETRRETCNRFPLSDFRRKQSCWHLKPRLLASRTMKQYVSVV